MPRAAPDAGTSSATRPVVVVAVEPSDAGGGRERVDRQHVGTELGEQVGHHERDRAEPVVDHDLQVGGRDPLEVDRGLDGRGVVLERPGHVVDVADLGREHPPIVLTVENPFESCDGSSRPCRRHRGP